MNRHTPASRSSADRLKSLRSLFARSDEPYAGADLDNAKRLGALLLVLDGLFCLALLPISPPDAHGKFGWAVAGIGVLLLLLGASRLAASRRVQFGELLAVSYLMIAQIAVFAWLAGSGYIPYSNLYLLPVVFAAGIHPPRRVWGVLVVVAVAAALPLATEGWNDQAAADIGVQLLLWVALAGAMMSLMAAVRGQRLMLRAGEARAQRLARVDPLTGLGNRRAFDENLAAEIARARRSGASLSVMVVDLDDFKQINDGFGHLSGDRCLREVAAKLTEAARTSDLCFRWGGDEFALLLPDTDSDGADQVAQRVGELVGGAVLRPDGRPLHVTCGCAELTEAANADDFLSAADLALMSLKTPSETIEHSDETGSRIRGGAR